MVSARPNGFSLHARLIIRAFKSWLLKDLKRHEAKRLTTKSGDLKRGIRMKSNLKQ